MCNTGLLGFGGGKGWDSVLQLNKAFVRMVLDSEGSPCIFTLSKQVMQVVSLQHPNPQCFPQPFGLVDRNDLRAPNIISTLPTCKSAGEWDLPAVRWSRSKCPAGSQIPLGSVLAAGGAAGIRGWGMLNFPPAGETSCPAWSLPSLACTVPVPISGRDQGGCEGRREGGGRESCSGLEQRAHSPLCLGETLVFPHTHIPCLKNQKAQALSRICTMDKLPAFVLQHSRKTCRNAGIINK